jgi:hypothetical protein
MPIQDNVHGALLISAIDFILSFVIIGGIGVILALFPLLNRFGKRNDESPQNLALERSALKESGSATAIPITSPSAQSAVTGGIHPGLTDQQLVVLLTAAACEALGEPVRVDRFRRFTAKDWNWAVQGRHDLQSHRLK